MKEEGSSKSVTILMTSILTAAVCLGYFVFIQRGVGCQVEPRLWNARRNETKHLTTRIAWITLGLGKGYLKSALDFVESAETFFCSDRSFDVRYFIFSNHQINDVEDAQRYKSFPIWIFFQEKMGWPRDSDARFELILKRWNEMQLETFDYIFWTGNGATAEKEEPRKKEQPCDNLL